MKEGHRCDRVPQHRLAGDQEAVARVELEDDVGRGGHVVHLELGDEVRIERHVIRGIERDQGQVETGGEDLGRSRRVGVEVPFRRGRPGFALRRRDIAGHPDGPGHGDDTVDPAGQGWVEEQSHREVRERPDRQDRQGPVAGAGQINDQLRRGSAVRRHRRRRQVDPVSGIGTRPPFLGEGLGGAERRAATTGHGNWTRGEGGHQGSSRIQPAGTVGFPGAGDGDPDDLDRRLAQQACNRPDVVRCHVGIDQQADRSFAGGCRGQRRRR